MRTGRLRHGLATLIVALVLAVATSPLQGAVAAETATNTLTTVAGGPGRGAAGNISMEPVAVATNGNVLYVADRTYGLVRAVDLAAGTTSVLTGSDTARLPWSGALPVPGVADPCALALDPSGALHVGDAATRRVYRVGPEGGLTTVIGPDGSTADTSAAQTALQTPCGLTFDGAGNLYIADSGTDVVSRLDLDGQVTRVAGGGRSLDGARGDGGPAVDAVLSDPTDVDVDASGAIFITETGRIRRIGADGTITTYAGDGRGEPESGDGGPASATSIGPRRVDLVGGGGMYVVERNRVRLIDAAGIITTVAGADAFGGIGDGGPAGDALFYAPADVAVDSQLGLVVADTGTGRVRVIDAAGVVRTVAGLPRHPSRYGESGYPERTRLGGDGGPAINGQLHQPGSLALTPTGTVLIADVGNKRVREINSGGLLETRAGGSCCWAFSDGPTAVPEIRSVGDLAAGPDGDVYVQDGNRIKRVAHDGTVTIVAGTGYSGAGGDGVDAQDASLASAASVAVAHDGAVYIGQQDQVGRVEADGTLTRYAGGGWGLGDGGPARNASLATSYSRDIALDDFGNLYITDAGRIRKVNTAGVISTVAGTGVAGYSGDGGSALAAQIAVTELTVAADGSIVFANPVGWGTVIRRVTPTGQIETLAGSGAPGFAADGIAVGSARFTTVTGVAATADGVVFVSDTTAHRVRSFSFTPGTPPVRPATVTGLELDAAIGKAGLRWSHAEDDVRAGVMIRQTRGNVAARTPMDGQLVYDGRADGVVATGLTNGETFTFTAFAYTRDGLFSHPVARTAWPTTLTAVPRDTRIQSGDTVVLRGRLTSVRDSGTPLAGRLIRIDVRRRGTTRWSVLARQTTSSTGSFVVRHTPTWNAQYRAVFDGRAAQLGSRSAVTTVMRG